MSLQANTARFLRHTVRPGCVRGDIRFRGKSKLKGGHALLGLMRVARFRPVAGNTNSRRHAGHRKTPLCSLRGETEKRNEILYKVTVVGLEWMTNFVETQ